ncbi:uncharacterized protein TA16205 [Theileria annulata]|uniref:Uncharacterized protein n=1 Tax=Theileria annulata TaxID=5874 RepID=Q4UIS2_THEAN|nr:uncharacterized protein TA16205 [Theileria annulata]CAI73017.1 hypothetical protein TA16205 [Theileria annulata]|eukprot:XP_953695.1 hypothetical protein TA16205 [Theileria annulata]
MKYIYFVILLCFVRNVDIVNSLVADSSCFHKKSLLLLEKTSKEKDQTFYESLSKLENNPFTLVVRYCLGADGNVSSRKFVECVSSLSSCPTNWYSTINWQFCLCNTVYCVLKGCFQYWIETFDFTNTKVLYTFSLFSVLRSLSPRRLFMHFQADWNDPL